MSRPIDADALRKSVLDLPNCYNGFSDTYDKSCIIGLIDEQPTVDVRPNVRGKWIDARCSLCGEEAITEWNETGGALFYSNFCPNCGADMRGDTE